jgi:AcrR family transcriptional regulator
MPRPVKKTADKWKQDILQAAQSLFISKGYAETSVHDIMEAAGGAKGMFYRSFESKEEILNAIVAGWADAYARAVTGVLQDPDTSFGDKFARILGVIAEMSQKTSGMEAFFTSDNEIMLNRLAKKMTATFVPLLSRVLQSGMEEGVLHIDDPVFYANYIIHGALGALNYGGGTPGQNIAANLKNLPNAVAGTLQMDVNALAGGFNRKGEK